MLVNVSLAFLIEIGKLIQVTNITRSNRDKSLYNVHGYKRQNRSTNLQTA